jgi:hypothetical protein
MTPDQLEHGELPIYLLGLFPPVLRASALEDKEFRDCLGLSVDANIKLDQIDVTFKRSELFKNARDLYASVVTEAPIDESRKITWLMSIDAERARIKIVSGGKTFLIPDFSCLHPVSAERLKWFDAEVAKFGVKMPEFKNGALCSKTGL